MLLIRKETWLDFGVVNMIINEKFKGNWKDYLKYAVGEILLVVFGILIALQINNWNEDRKERIHEIELINLLITDLNDRKAENISDRESGLSMINHFVSVLDYWEQNNDLDTLKIKRVLRSLADDSWYYHNETPTYKRLSNSSLWEKIPDSLATEINYVYYSRFTRIKVRFDTSREYAFTCKVNYLRPNGLIDLKQSSVALKNKILKNPEEFISYLELFIVNVERLNSSFQSSENSIEKVVQKLHKYKNSISS